MQQRACCKLFFPPLLPHIAFTTVFCLLKRSVDRVTYPPSVTLSFVQNTSKNSVSDSTFMFLPAIKFFPNKLSHSCVTQHQGKGYNIITKSNINQLFPIQEKLVNGMHQQILTLDFTKYKNKSKHP